MRGPPARDYYSTLALPEPNGENFEAVAHLISTAPFSNKPARAPSLYVNDDFRPHQPQPAG